MSAHESTQIAQTALTGTRSRFETWRQRLWPGTARSRENANIIRDADVTDASPQKNWATQAITSRNSAHLSPIAVCQMYCTAKVYWPAVLPTGPGIANVIATSRMNPNITDTTTDMTMPMAAEREAFRVSSLMCADASKPVIVYWAISRPMPNTKKNALSENPELLIVWVNTNAADWWCGTTASTTTISPTPTMCQYAEIVLSRACRPTPNRFIPRCSAMITV